MGYKQWKRGQVLVLFALSLVVLIGLAGLGVDIGHWYSVRHELQRCADTGALAGASAFIEFDPPPADPEALAIDRAIAFATKDIVLTTPLDNNMVTSNSTQEVEVSILPVTESEPYHRVRVGTHRTVPLFFSRIFGRHNILIRAYAVAKAEPSGENITFCLKPWGIPFPVDNTGMTQKDCPDSEDSPLTYNERANYFCRGTRIILKQGVNVNANDNTVYASILEDIAPDPCSTNPPPPPSQMQAHSHFFPLNIDAVDMDCPGPTPGGHSYEESIADPTCESIPPISIGSTICTEQGDKVGPTALGVDKLTADDPIGPNQWYCGTQALHFTDSHPITSYPGGWEKSPRIIQVPVYDPNITTPEPGRDVIEVAGFAAFWIETYLEKNGRAMVVGRFLEFKNPTGGSGGPGPDSSMLWKIKLVE